MYYKIKSPSKIKFQNQLPLIHQ